MTAVLEDILKDAKQILRAAGISSWALDGDILMAHAVKMRRESLITQNRYVLSQEELELFWASIEKRRNHQPVAYIVNNVEFMGLNFYVDENVLIPRPDTEILVEASIKHINESGVKAVLDMCTGSGAIAVSISHFCPHAKITAADISRKALEIARLNSERNNVLINFVESDMFENIEETFDVIVSNPPYISVDEMSELPDSVAKYEPHMALYGGEDGLSFYRRLLKAGKYLHETGVMIIEIGAYQKDNIVDIFFKEGFCLKSAHKDLAGLDRTLIFGKNI